MYILNNFTPSFSLKLWLVSLISGVGEQENRSWPAIQQPAPPTTARSWSAGKEGREEKNIAPIGHIFSLFAPFLAHKSEGFLVERRIGVKVLCDICVVPKQ